ncbi:MAG: DUF1810 domain-containing protein, partial [Actinomycetota bacterium]
ELRAGHKRGHWIWFVFPQVAGLGTSPTSRFYALVGVDEAHAYLAHPVLGARLVECAAALLDLSGHDPVAVLGGIDAQKLRSSMTLFARAATDGEQRAVFRTVLERYFDGVDDPQTLRRLAGPTSSATPGPPPE